MSRSDNSFVNATSENNKLILFWVFMEKEKAI